MRFTEPYKFRGREKKSLWMLSKNINALVAVHGLSHNSR